MHRTDYAMAYYPPQGAVILFGGLWAPPVGPSAALGDTWEFANGHWIDLTASLPSAPAPRYGAGLVFDARLGELVLFGGRVMLPDGYFTPANDTWTYGPAGWVNVTRTHAPDPTTARDLVYDSEDGYVLLVSDNASGSPVHRYWSFQSGNWTDVTARVARGLPSALEFYAADDPADGYVVFFGGNFAVCGAIGQAGAALTFAFVGGNFTNLTGNQSFAPADRYGPSGQITYDPNLGVVMFSGLDATCGGVRETYAFTGGMWSNLTARVGPAPPSEWDGHLAFDPALGGDFLFGATEWPSGGSGRTGNYSWALPTGIVPGATVSTLNSQVPVRAVFTSSPRGGVPQYHYSWSFGDGSPNATTRNATHTYLAPGVYAAELTVSDAFGSRALAQFSIDALNDLPLRADWKNLSRLSIGADPPPRDEEALAYDPALPGSVLFGGDGEFGGYGLWDTWVFENGSWVDWTSRLTTHPTARCNAGLVFDPSLQKLLLFGGVVGCSFSGFANDTWEFGGSGWSRINTTLAPPAGPATGMVYDTTDGYVLLVLNRTVWKFANNSWTNLTAEVRGEPPSGLVYAAADDPAGHQVVVFGGDFNGACSRVVNGYGLTFSYANGTFRNLTPNESLRPRDWMGPERQIDYDPNLGGVLMTGGRDQRCVPEDGTYLFRDGNWSALGPYLSAAPPADWGGAMTYDGSLGADLVFGGNLELVSTFNYDANGLWGLQTGVNGTASESARAGPAPLVVQFAANGTTPSASFRYDWTFGDGSPDASSPLVNHSYLTPGNYTASVTVTSWAGGWWAEGFPVEVVSVLGLEAGASVTIGYVPLAVAFNATPNGGSGPYSYSWNFGGGLPAATGQNPSYTFSSPGDHNVSVQVRDSVGQVANRTILVRAAMPLSVGLSANRLVGVAPMSVHFTPSFAGGFGPVQLLWSFSDGSTATGPAVLTKTFGRPGTYTVTIEAVDALNSTSVRALNITAVTGLTVGFAPSSPSVGVGQTLSLRAAVAGGSGPFSFGWSGLPEGCSGANQSAISCKPSSVGQYSVVLTVNDSLGESRQAELNLSVVSPAATSSGFTLGLPAELGIAVAGAAALGLGVLLWRRRVPRNPDRSSA